MKKAWFIGLLVLVVLISGCTSGTYKAPPETGTPPKQTTPPPPLTATVQNIDFTFYPAEVVIAKGGTVTWEQKQYEAHTVTGEGFDSGNLAQGKTYSHTFNETGTFNYWCKNHPSMRGKVIVK